MDIFGKTKPILSLDGWATPGVPHAIENEYGLDVLKVGRALGVGGFGAWIDGRIQKVSNVMKTHHIRADGPSAGGGGSRVRVLAARAAARPVAAGDHLEQGPALRPAGANEHLRRPEMG